MKVLNWFRQWWVTWRVWRNADADQRRILTTALDPDDCVEVHRPGHGV